MEVELFYDTEAEDEELQLSGSRVTGTKEATRPDLSEGEGESKRAKPATPLNPLPPMSDTTRRMAPDERGAPTLAPPLHAIPTDNHDFIDITHTSQDVTSVTKTTVTFITDPTNLATHTHIPSSTLILRDIVNALDTNDRMVAPIVIALPTNWSNINAKGTTITKRKLEQYICGAHTESDSLQNLQ